MRILGPLAALHFYLFDRNMWAMRRKAVLLWIDQLVPRRKK